MLPSGLRSFPQRKRGKDQIRNVRRRTDGHVDGCAIRRSPELWNHESPLQVTMQSFLFRLAKMKDTHVPRCTIAHIAGNACGRSRITGRPAVRKSRFPDKRSGERQEIHLACIHDLFHPVSKWFRDFIDRNGLPKVHLP